MMGQQRPQRRKPFRSKARKVKHNTQRTCAGKVRYRDKKEAKEALKRISQNSSRDKAPRRDYFCAMCKGWHLTSRPDKYDVA